MNQHYFDVPFAFSGDKTAIPDPLQVGGTVSMTEGWNYNYQRNMSTDPAALPIDRSTTNWILNQITIALQALQQQGVPEWITSAQNGGVAYSYGKGAVVLWSASGNAPFTKYVNLNAGNTNTPSVGDPQGLTTGWQVVVDPIATAAMATAGTDDASIMTPLKVASQVALRALLAGSATQVFNVATATSATQALQKQQKGIQTFTSSGTFVAPVTGTYWYSGCAGGGGGGGGGSNNTSNASGSGGAGGGAGQPAIRVPVTLTAGVTYTITLGAGGVGGTGGAQGANNAGVGTAGGNTTMTGSGLTTITLTGASAAPGGASAEVGGAGGSGNTGYPPGGSGANASAAATGTSNGPGGTGASGPFGGGGPGGRSGQGAGITGSPAYGYGAGGGAGGPAYGAGGAGGPGAAGAPGFFMLEW